MKPDREAQTMTNDTHTPEPWRIFEMGNKTTCGVMVDYGTNADICHIKDEFDITRPKGTSLANARRIVACVNACAGITTEELEDFGVGGIDEWMLEADSELRAACNALEDVDYSGRCEHGVYALKQQRDELRDLLIECKRELRAGISMGLHGDMGRKLDEAIAKAGVQ